MKARCLNPRHKAYPRYGGRGIIVCKRWLKFDNFLSDMGLKPDGKSLDRIDNSKGYEPENCRWATAKQQNRNTRSNRLVLFAGREIPLVEAIELSGKQDQTYAIRGRLGKGWTPEEALYTPIGQKNKKIPIEQRLSCAR